MGSQEGDFRYVRESYGLHRGLLVTLERLRSRALAELVSYVSRVKSLSWLRSTVGLKLSPIDQYCPHYLLDALALPSGPRSECAEPIGTGFWTIPKPEKALPLACLDSVGGVAVHKRPYCACSMQADPTIRVPNVAEITQNGSRKIEQSPVSRGDLSLLRRSRFLQPPWSLVST